MGAKHSLPRLFSQLQKEEPGTFPEGSPALGLGEAAEVYLMCVVSRD